MDNYSALQIWKNYFRFIGMTGLNIVDFSDPPSNLKYPSLHVTRGRHSFPQAVYKLLVRTVTYGTLCSYFVFCIVRMFMYFSQEHTVPVTRAACWVWVLFGATGVGPVLIFAAKTDDVQQFIQAWIAFDMKLLADLGQRQEVSKETGGVSIPDLLATERKRFRCIIFFIIAVMIIDTALVGFNSYGVPRMPLYLSSLAAPDNLQPWYYAFSIGFQMFIVFTTNLMRYQLFAFSSCVTHCLTLYLKCITPTLTLDDYCLTERGTYVSQRVEKPVNFRYAESCIDYYMVVYKLSKKFNKLFRWSLGVQKCLLIVFTAFMIFVFVRKQSHTPWYVMVVFMWASGSILVRTYATGVDCARLFAASEKFSETWKEAVVFGQKEMGEFNQNLLDKFKACPPIGISIGNMYIVKPQTVLTYFSVVSTYLCIVLQIRK